MSPCREIVWEHPPSHPYSASKVSCLSYVEAASACQLGDPRPKPYRFTSGKWRNGSLHNRRPKSSSSMFIPSFSTNQDEPRSPAHHSPGPDHSESAGRSGSSQARDRVPCPQLLYTYIYMYIYILCAAYTPESLRRGKNTLHITSLGNLSLLTALCQSKIPLLSLLRSRRRSLRGSGRPILRHRNI